MSNPRACSMFSLCFQVRYWFSVWLCCFGLLCGFRLVACMVLAFVLNSIVFLTLVSILVLAVVVLVWLRSVLSGLAPFCLVQLCSIWLWRILSLSILMSCPLPVLFCPAPFLS